MHSLSLMTHVVCSVLQYVAVCCSVLQCVAVCCSVLQCVAVCCSRFIVTDVISDICHMQYVAVCCSMLQCVAGKIECMRERYVECCSSHVYIYFV